MSDDQVKSDLDIFIEGVLGLSSRRIVTGDYQSFGASCAAKGYEHFQAKVIALRTTWNPETIAKVIATGGPHDLEDRVLVEMQADLPAVGAELIDRAHFDPIWVDNDRLTDRVERLEEDLKYANEGRDCLRGALNEANKIITRLAEERDSLPELKAELQLAKKLLRTVLSQAGMKSTTNLAKEIRQFLSDEK